RSSVESALRSSRPTRQIRSSSAFSIKGLVTSRRAVAAASCVASFATRVLRCTWMPRYSTDKTTATELTSCETALIASQFICCQSYESLGRVVNFQDDFAKRVMCLDFLVRFARVGQRQRLRHNRLHFPRL